MQPYYWVTGENVRAAVAPFGATLGRLEVRLADGTWRNVVLTRADPGVPVATFFGATAGRFANRLANAQFSLDGQAYQLPANDGPNQLHGGPGGFDRRQWMVIGAQPDKVVLELTSLDGDQGYPGTVLVTAEFSAVDGGVQVEYVVTTDAPTIVNITTHPYFNLHGAGVGTIDDHTLCAPASRFTPTDEANIPTGEIRDVDGLGLDFRKPRALGEARAALLAEGLGRTDGFDYNLIVDGEGLREHVRLSGPDGLTLVVRSDAPAFQMYDASRFDGSDHGPDGEVYQAFGGLAIEPQNYPDAPNHADFPSAVLRPDDEYRRVIQWLVSAAG